MKKGIANYIVNHSGNNDFLQTDKSVAEGQDVQGQGGFYRNQTYPISQLCQNAVRKEQLTGTIEDDQIIDLANEDFSSKIIVTAVFATNCNQIHIPKIDDLNQMKKKDTLLKRFDYLGYPVVAADSDKIIDAEQLKDHFIAQVKERDNGTLGDLVVITQEDVDLNGIITNSDIELPQYIRSRLRKKVQLKFEFYSNTRFTNGKKEEISVRAQKRKWTED